MMKKLALLLAFASALSAQTLTTVTGTIKDLTGATVTSGRIVFTTTLNPGQDATIPGVARFVPSTTYCRINNSGQPVSNTAPYTAPCTITKTTALSPSGISYATCVQPYNVSPGGCFNFFATLDTVDISTIAPTPTTLPTNYAGMQGPPFDVQGAWSSTFSYRTGQVVTYNNAVYISLISPNLNNVPSSSPSAWTQISLPGSVVTGPTTGQVITQPSGTSLDVNVLNHELNATLFTGADIGAKINAAIAQLGCGTILVPTGTYNFTTQIIKPRCILIRGQGVTSSVLNYTATSGYAVAVGDSGSGTQYGVGGITDLTVKGTGTGLGTTNTSVGLWIGGDPASAALPSGYQADNQRFTGLAVTGFEAGVKTGNNAYVNTFLQSNIWGNYDGVTEVTSPFNSGENNRFIASDIFNNIRAAFYQSGPWKLLGSSIDYNGDSTPTLQGTKPQIVDTSIECYGCHIEYYSGPLSSGNTSLKWIGGTVVISGTNAITDAVLFETTSPNMSISGTDIFSGHNVTYLAKSTGGSTASVYIDALTGNGNGKIAGTLDPTSTAGFIYLNPQAQFLDGTSITRWGNVRLSESGGFVNLTNSGTSGFKFTPMNGNSIFYSNTLINAPNFDAVFNTVQPANGFNGSCPTGTTIAVSHGIITGCS